MRESGDIDHDTSLLTDIRGVRYGGKKVGSKEGIFLFQEIHYF